MIRILKIAFFILFIMGVLSLMGFIFIETGNQPLKEVIVRIDRETEKGFLDEAKLRSLIEKTDSVSRKTSRQVNVEHIEALIGQNVFVSQVDAFINLDKNLIINVKEQQPLLRIFPKGGDGFYISREGNMFPLSDNYTARVLVVNGYLETAFNRDHASIFDTVHKQQVLRDVFRLANLIGDSEFLNAQISQVYINSKGEYDLIPGLGDHIIQMGRMENAAQKLQNLETWYRKAMVNEDWNKYKIINIKYKNQVVCTQN